MARFESTTLWEPRTELESLNYTDPVTDKKFCYALKDQNGTTQWFLMKAHETEQLNPLVLINFI